MRDLQKYKNLTEKRLVFDKGRKSQFYRIESIWEFDNWYNNELEKFTNNKRYIYRGMSGAKYKLYNSAQRFWLLNSLTEWKGKEEVEYLRMVKFMIKRAKIDPLFKKVFEFYQIKRWETDFPLMSILQHYGAPTPLLDWTYNLDISLFFATEKINYTGSNRNIDDFFTIYRIDKEKSPNYTFKNLKGISRASIPKLDNYFGFVDRQNEIFFLSDFEDDKITTKKNILGQFTSIYNQNIIPQEGLLIFNPFADMPFEDYFQYSRSPNRPISCVNIHKHIAEYIRRRLKKKKIVESFIYPKIQQNAIAAVHKYLDDITKRS